MAPLKAPLKAPKPQTPCPWWLLWVGVVDSSPTPFSLLTPPPYPIPIQYPSLSCASWRAGKSITVSPQTDCLEAFTAPWFCCQKKSANFAANQFLRRTLYRRLYFFQVTVFVAYFCAILVFFLGQFWVKSRSFFGLLNCLDTAKKR